MHYKNQLKELEAQLDNVTRYAHRTIDSPVNELNRPYNKMVSAAEEADALSKKIGKSLCKTVDTKDENTDFFWKNELWKHSDFEIDTETAQLLNVLYTLPFAYELDSAYGPKEKVDLARFALSEVKRKKEEVAELIELLD